MFSRGYFVSIQSRIGDATYTELNVPVTMPNAITHANGRITSPAKKSSASVAASAVACVRTERGSVSFTDRLSVSYSGSRRFLRRFSRTRSKMMIVSLREYPITVSSAATIVSEISRCMIFRNAIVVRMSCMVAMVAATPNRQSNRNARYASVTANDTRMAMIAPRRSSLPTMAPTASVRTTWNLSAPNDAPSAVAIRRDVESAAPAFASERARTVKSLGEPNVAISDSLMPPASSAARTFAGSGACVKWSCISVPPTNSTLYSNPPLSASEPRPMTMNAIVRPAAHRQKRMKSIFVSCRIRSIRCSASRRFGCG